MSRLSYWNNDGGTGDIGTQGSLITVILTLLALLIGCGSSSRSGSSAPVPSSISVAPQVISLDLGATAFVSAAGRNFAGTPIALTFAWASNNPSIASVSNTGLICAGTWDSLTNPVVCTPSAVGTAQITASASGITSAPVTIYVHPHIDQIKISALPQTPGTPGQVNGCYSSASTTQPAATQSYEAIAYSNGVDISALVGPFTWSTSSTQVVTLKQLTDVNGVQNGRVQGTANVPGRTVISAAISGTNGSIGATSPLQTFTTCPVQSISLALNSGGSTFTGTKGTGFNITATVFDTNHDQIIGAPLTWTSTQAAANVSATGAVTNTNSGGTSVTASCAPPTCNINLTNNSVPLLEAVYAVDPIAATWSPSSTTSTASTIYVSSTGCSTASAAQNCTTAVIPISGSTAALGPSAAMANVPNSFRFDSKGTTAYLGTSNGLMQLVAGTPPALNLVAGSARGKILAISPDGRRVIVADTQSTPNQVFIHDSTNSTTPLTTLLITGATAAAFSPDNLKAFIAAHNPSTGANTLYVFSSQLPLQSGALSGTPSDVGFLGNGMFGYIAEGSQLQYLALCNDPAAPLAGQLGTVNASAALLRPLPGNSFLTFNSPNVARVDATVGGAPAVGQIGCPAPPFGPPNGAYTLSHTVSAPANLGQGTFTPVAFAVSTDGQKAYALASNVGSLIIFDVTNQATSTIPLVGSPAPLAGALAPDGLTFYITANDGNLHVINLIAGGDVQQLAIPERNLCGVSTGTAPTCLPDLLAVP